MQLQFKMYIWLCLACCFFLSAGCTYTTIHTRQHQVFFQYRREHRSERDLPICSETSVCTVLHQRYWLPAIGERLCRCIARDECSWKWAQYPDNFTMSLNNRSQLKFCSPVNTLKTCTNHETALLTTTETTGNITTFFETKARCYCPQNRYWKHFRKISQFNLKNNTKIVTHEYKCKELEQCSTMEFCGNVRTDHKSIYYICSCPYRHQCLFTEDNKSDASELFYNGSVFSAVCKPDPGSDYDY